MPIIEMMLQELEREAHTTRRVLERVPEDKLGWKPHEKSMSLGQLALHIATTPGAVAELSQKSPCPVFQFEQPSATTAAELIPAMEESVAKAKEILSGLDDEALGNIWRLVDGDRDLMAIPVGGFLRSVMLNHWYHHRGQLSVYLRQVGALVPPIYGPSADENPFAQQMSSTAAE